MTPEATREGSRESAELSLSGSGETWGFLAAAALPRDDPVWELATYAEQMDNQDILQALDRAEAALQEGRGLKGTGFWKAVGEVKRSPELAGELGSRIAEIDRRAFENWALLVVPIGLGTFLAVATVLIGLGGIVAMYYLSEPWNWLVFGLAVLALLVSTHGLAHLVVGRSVGMRFSSWFVGRLTRPQPGIKIDYATYLLAPARGRAWMHASGALVGKIVPFALLPAAIAADLPAWVVWALGVFGVGQIATDLLWSTKSSDWKRFRREMSYADRGSS